MIITCPVCATSYKVDASKMGGAGRMVRCRNCGHQWFQEAEPAHAETAAATAEAAGNPPIEARREEAPMEAPKEAPAEPAPAAPAEAETGAAESVELPSQEDIDSLFEEETPEPAASPGVAERVAEEAAAAPAAEGLLEEQGAYEEGVDEGYAEEPAEEPIPEVFTAPSAAHKEQRGAGTKVAVALLLIVAAAIAGGYLARDTIITAWPDAGALYEMLGLESGTLGKGLDIRNVKTDREVFEGREALVVSGSIINVTDLPRQVPMIKVSLFDAQGEEVQSVVVPPESEDLEPGDNVGFKARLVDPAPVARRVEVTFTKGRGPAAQG
jgi:predicted Zn finger-like uncharacterized protein